MYVVALHYPPPPLPVGAPYLYPAAPAQGVWDVVWTGPDGGGRSPLLCTPQRTGQGHTAGPEA